MSGVGWLYWDGKRWKRDETNRAIQIAGNTVREIYGEAASLSELAANVDSDEREQLGATANKITAHALKSESYARIMAMINLGAAQPRLTRSPETLDANPGTLNVDNGILDLETYELLPQNPRAHHTKITRAAFNPKAQSGLWHDFLGKVLPDEEIQQYVQKGLGSSLRGRYSEELFIPWGSGKNGKSTLLRAVRHALGDYAGEAAPELLIAGRDKRNAGDMSALAVLRGKRLVTTIETGEGKRMDEVLVKQLTGEHRITAKFMRQDWFEFENQATIWLCTNHKPYVQGTDIAVWDRVHLIPFNVYLEPKERDAELGAKLEAESDAVLAWLVEGLRLYREEGLQAPSSVREATDAYRQEMDPLGGWLEECCVLDAEARTPISQVRKSYARYCKEQSIGELGGPRFNQQLEERGLKRLPNPVRIDRKQWKVWEGIRLQDEWHTGFEPSA